MTMNEARAALLDIPAHKINNNCVIDSQKRLREVLKLAEQFYKGEAQAPGYVVDVVKGLKSWIDHVQ